MANIVGLGNTQDAVSTVGQRRLRDSEKLADGLDVVKPVQLRPTAQPVDFYARPAQAPINNDLQNLAEGLASLNPALQHFAAVQKQEDKKVDKDQVAAALAGKSPEEIDQIIKTNPIFQKAVNAQRGGELQARAQADADTSWWVNHYNTEFDKQNGNLASQFDEFVAKRTQQFGGNKGYADAYMEQMAGSKNSLMNRWLQDRAQISQYQQQQVTQDGMASIIRQAANTGQSQESLMNDVSNFIRNNKDIARLPYKDQQQYILNGLQPLLNDMDQRPEMRDKIYAAVNTVLTAPRKGEDGVERRLIDAPQGMGDAYKGLLADFAKKRDSLNDRYLTNEKTQWEFNAEHNPETFTDKQLDEWNAAHNYTYTPSQIESLKLKRANALQKLADKRAADVAQERADGAKATITQQNLQQFENGDFLFPKDHDVPTKDFFLKEDQHATQKFTADQQREAVMEAYSKKLDFAENQLVNQKKMTPEQAKQWRMGQELDTFRLNGYVPPQWKQELAVGANQLTVAAQTSSKEMPQQALQAFERYKLLASKAPNLLNEATDERTRQIFGTAMLVDGSPTDQLRGAIQYYANRDEKREQVAQKQVSETIDGLKPGAVSRLVGRIWGNEAPENLSFLNDKISKRASYLVQAYHMTPDDAVEKAAKSLRGSYAIVNGWAVDTNDKRLPPNFEKLAEKYIENVVSVTGPERWGAKSAKDLTLFPMSDGTFQIFNKRHGYPSEGETYIEGPDGNFDARFLTPEMMQWLQTQERQKSEIRATRAGDEYRQRAGIAAKEGVAVQQGFDALKGATHNPFKPFILNKNSK